MAKEPERANSSFLKPRPKDTSPGHFRVPLAKSLIRIGAGASLMLGLLPAAGLLLLVAEFLGIVEELM